MKVDLSAGVSLFIWEGAWGRFRIRPSCMTIFYRRRNCFQLPRRSAAFSPGWVRRKTGLVHVSNSWWKIWGSTNSGSWSEKNDGFFLMITDGLPTWTKNLPGEKLLYTKQARRLPMIRTQITENGGRAMFFHRNSPDTRPRPLLCRWGT